MIRASRHGTAHATRVAQATPAGGARFAWGRGCIYVLASLAALALPVRAQALLPVPSGQPVELADVLLDNNPGELWVRFRFLAPRIGDLAGQIGYDVAAIDMAHLCQILAVPYVETRGITPARVVISMSDRPIEFGASQPGATQYFEAYRLQDSRCIWEEF